MKLDEQLANIEKQQEQELKQKEFENSVIERLEKEQENQKTVEEYETEIRAGKVVFYDREYACERVKFLNKEIYLPVFENRKVTMTDEPTLAIISDDDFNTSINLFVSELTMSGVTPEQYKKEVTEQFHQSQVTFQANGEGVFRSKDKKIVYVTGVVSVSVGNIYQIIFCVPVSKGVLIGSFSCLLKERFVFEHFFFAVMKQFFD